MHWQWSHSDSDHPSCLYLIKISFRIYSSFTTIVSVAKVQPLWCHAESSFTSCTTSVSDPMPVSHYVLSHLKTDTHTCTCMHLPLNVQLSAQALALHLNGYWKVCSQRETLTFPWTLCTHKHAGLDCTRSHTHSSVPITHICLLHTIALINWHFSASVGPTPRATS